MSKKKDNAEEIKEEINQEVKEEVAEDATNDYEAPAEEEAPQKSKEEEYLLMAQRIQADFDNYRKRNVSMRADAILDGKVEAIKAFLPVMDNLERALLEEAKNGTTGSLMEGLELVLKQMQTMLTELKVEEIEAEGKPFDPNFHNAVMQIPAQEGQDKNIVANVFSKGYKIGDKVIRYSMVQVTI